MTNLTFSTRVQAPTTNLSAVEACSDEIGNNEDVFLNPDGRNTLDSNNKAGKNEKSKNQRNKLINCKAETKISFQNVRTLKQKEKRIELANLVTSKGINFLGIADHKLVHTDDGYQTEQLQNCTMITTSAWRNNNNAACGGVGFMLSNKIESALADVEPVNERILCAHFNGNPAVTVIVHYSPIEGSDMAEEHYSNLANTINSMPKHNIVLVMGDFNAHIGKEDAQYTYHEHTNNNGKLLLNLAE